MSYQFISSSQIHLPQESTLVSPSIQCDQPFNPIEELLIYSLNFYLHFIDPFESYLECLLTQKNVNISPHLHNTNSFMQAQAPKDTSLELALLFSLLSNSLESLIEIHPSFYDPFETWMENSFNERNFVNRFIFLYSLEIDERGRLNFSFNNLVIIIFSLLIHNMYIFLGIKEFNWLPWKYVLLIF